jgi:predicted metal-dependent HD superfamily phosphohydrolase
MSYSTLSPISGKLRDELVRAYMAPDRHYHNLAHIEALLGLMRTHEHALSDPASLEAAIWFHDAVYDTRRHDNEEKSAQLAAERLDGLLSPDRIDRIATMIRATAGHVVPERFDDAARHDCALFLDMDLGVLGSTPDAFAAYESAVRREYAWVPDALWIEGRRKVLQGFLARPTIFASPQFRASHEAAARRNLTRSLEQLAQQP